MRPYLLAAGLTALVLSSSRASAIDPSPTAPPATEPAPVESPVAGGREVEWYTAEVPVSSEERREREAALGRALAQVLVRVTGRVDAAAGPVVQRALRAPEPLLLGSEYRTVEEVAGGVPVQRLRLAATFDPDAVDALVVAAGLPLWSGTRPRPLLWLAIDDGGGAGPRRAAAPQVNVVKPLAQRGLERGLRLLLPAGNAVEQQAAGSAWALDAAALAVLSARYEAPVALIGRMGRSGGGWSAEWVLAEGGGERKRWTFADPNPQRVLASGADPLADALAAVAAKVVPVGAAETLVARIDGIRGAEDWLALSADLQGSPVLKGYDVIEARVDSVTLRLSLAVDRTRFEALVGGGRLLEVTSGAGDPPAYRLVH